jgi:flagellar FliL protein
MITYNIMSKGGKSQTVVTDPSSPYLGKRPEYAYYDQIGSITTRTRDYPVSSSVTVEMIIGYDLNDSAATLELIGRRHELRDFIRRYFTNKYTSDLLPEKEDDIKREIREQLNTRFLDTARVRLILFNRLDVMDMNF